jgi:hypothetical protein
MAARTHEKMQIFRISKMVSAFHRSIPLHRTNSTGLTRAESHPAKTVASERGLLWVRPKKSNPL